MSAEVVMFDHEPIYSVLNEIHIACACGHGADKAGYDWEDHAQHVAAAIREAATITSVEQLDTLPVGALIRDDESVVSEKQPDGQWWVVAEPHYGRISASVILRASPVTLLWTPEEQR